VDPPPFPRTTADLEEWSVYGDYLQGQGDPRGELIAHELALPEALVTAAVREYQALATPIWRQRGTVRFAISLGHLRAMRIMSQPGQKLSRHGVAPSAGTIANAGDLLRTAAAQTLEELDIAYQPGSDDKLWTRLFAGVPSRCTRLYIALVPRFDPSQVAELLARIPGHVRELTLHSFRERARVTDVVALVDDRFDVIDTSSYVDAEPSVWLANTQHVRLRVRRTTSPSLPPRVELGAPGDAILVGLDGQGAMSVRQWRLLELEQRYGRIPIRTLLARGLPEETRVFASIFVRRGDRFTIRGSAKAVVACNGAVIPEGELHVATYGDRLRFGDFGEWQLVTRS
jgi:hypothetical protein